MRRFSIAFVVLLIGLTACRRTSVGEKKGPSRVITAPEKVTEPPRQKAPPKPPEPEFPLHGVVAHYLAQVFAEPSNKSRVAGYMRRGAQFRAKASVPGKGCSQGFFAITGGGFVCQGKGYLIGKDPQTFDPSPVQPSLGQALPYPYGKTVTVDVPEYWMLPTREEQLIAAQVMTDLHKQEERLIAAKTAIVKTGGSSENEARTEADDVDAPPPPGQSGEENAGQPKPATPDADTGVTIPSFIRMRMRPGYYVSLDRLEVTEEDERFYRTIRGGYVQADALMEVTPPAMRGVVLGDAWHLPLAFVMRGNVHGFRESQSGSLRDTGVLEKHTPIVIEREIDRPPKKYVVGTDGTVVRINGVRVARPSKHPPIVGPNNKWIHIKLDEQTLVAYEGDKPVFATLVSSGKEEHKTPTGVYQIQSKHISATMDDIVDPEASYSIEDVPWTMYFYGNFALHGAFWHNSFGQERSHGCVNLSPVDARWLFLWSTPALPPGWHGIFADPKHAGTWIFIEP